MYRSWMDFVVATAAKCNSVVCHGGVFCTVMYCGGERERGFPWSCVCLCVAKDHTWWFLHSFCSFPIPPSSTPGSLHYPTSLSPTFPPSPFLLLSSPLPPPSLPPPHLPHLSLSSTHTFTHLPCDQPHISPLYDTWQSLSWKPCSPNSDFPSPSWRQFPRAIPNIQGGTYIVNSLQSGTPEMRPPLYWGCFKLSQCMLHSANSPPEMRPPLDTLTGPKGGQIIARGSPNFIQISQPSPKLRFMTTCQAARIL